tara:strand:- start:1275 stop:1508 length:234 start_codon:yes stop_codon:yes gene_type:complete
MTFVIRQGYEFNESLEYNEVGHWGSDGKWHATDSGSLEAMEKKAHYLNGGSKINLDDLAGRVRIIEQHLKIDSTRFE